MKMEIRVKGKAVKVPAATIEDRTVIVTGKWIRMAVVHEEKWTAGDPFQDPQRFIQRLGGA